MSLQLLIHSLKLLRQLTVAILILFLGMSANADDRGYADANMRAWADAHKRAWASTAFLPTGVDQRESINIPQRQMAVVNLRKDESRYGPAAKFLKTVGLSTCTAVIFYDGVTKTGGMAHLDAFTAHTKMDLVKNINSFKGLFHYIGELPKPQSYRDPLISAEVMKRLRVVAVGGGQDPILFEKITNGLSQAGFENIEKYPRPIFTADGVSVILNLENGEISLFDAVPSYNTSDIYEVNVYDPNPKLKPFWPQEKSDTTSCITNLEPKAAK